MKELAKGQWTKEQAWNWYNRQPWIRGWCGYPSNCVNRIAMWQAYNHKEVAEQIDYEFGLAESIGFNAVRAIVQFEAWCFEHDSFMENLEEYLTMAHNHGIRVMLCLGNDCTVPKSRFKPVVFGEQKIDWGFHSGIRQGPHTGDYREPGYMLLDEPEYEKKYYEMVAELADNYGQDDRIQLWDVWNEPGNSNRGNMSLRAMEKFFEILREKKVKQPLTADGYRMATDVAQASEIEIRAMELSDIITFHYYGPYSNMVVLIESLRREYDRPLINNEWLNRYENNRYQEIFPLFYLEKIGSYSWGLMQGYSQTFEPWGGYFMNEAFKNGRLDLTKWQHDLYRFNGYPYDPNEIEIIKRFCTLAERRDGRR
ncbi:MAG: beta-galactosidase [Eubacteriales bacterium]